MRLLMMVSRSEPIITVTVTVNGVSAVAVEGAVKSRVACRVPQAKVARYNTATLSAHTRGRSRALPILNNCGLSEIPGLLNLFCVMMRVSKPYIHSEHRSVNVDSIVHELRFGQVPVRYVHVVHPSGKGVFGIQVVSDSGAHAVREREILPLRPQHTQRFLRIDHACTATFFEEGYEFPVAVDKIPANSEHK